MDLHTILRNIRKADQDYGLIADGDRIAVGVSGGKDSMVLLTALHMYAKFKEKNFQVIGIHIRLGFPNMDFTEVVSYCKKHGIAFSMHDSQVYEILKRNPGSDGSIQCSLCSKFKKATVIQAARAHGCQKVAFGHHSDDAIETVLMNAIYGGKLAVFLPKMYMTKTDITFIRPLLYAYESDIIKALHANHIPFVQSTCPNDGYTKRQEMKNMLQALYKKYPMARHNFLHMLSNEDQIELWHKKDTAITRQQKDKKMDIVYEEDSIQLGKRGNRFFIMYHPIEYPTQYRHQQISHQDADQLLQKKGTLADYVRSHSLDTTK